MIENLKKYILEKYLDYKLAQSKRDETMQDFAARVSSIRHILLIMPSDPASVDMFFEFASNLYPVFTDARVSTFERKSIRPEDCNWFGLPHRALLTNLAGEKVDLLIDLNTKSDKLCTYLCTLSDAPLKLNLAESFYSDHYNLHIRSRKGAHLSERLQNILKYLATLRQMEVAQSVA